MQTSKRRRTRYALILGFLKSVVVNIYNLPATLSGVPLASIMRTKFQILFGIDSSE